MEKEEEEEQEEEEQEEEVEEGEAQPNIWCLKFPILPDMNSLKAT